MQRWPDKQQGVLSPDLNIYTFSVAQNFPVAQMVKNLLAVQETRVQSLGLEYLLEKEIATHSGILAWKVPWMEEPGGLQSMGSQRVRYD